MSITRSSYLRYILFSFFIFIYSLTIYLNRVYFKKFLLSFYPKINKILLITIIYILLILVSYVRSFLNGVADFGWIIYWLLIWITLLLFIIELSLKYEHEKKVTVYKAIYNSIIVYVVCNILLYYIGLRSNLDRSDWSVSLFLLNRIGINVSRIFYPLTTGFNPFGMICGASVLISFYLSKYEKKIRIKIIYLIIAVISMFGLISSDIRSALIVTLFFIIISIFKISFFKKFYYIVFVLPFMPFVFVKLIDKLDNLEIINFFSRGSNLFLSGREFIWDNFFHLIKQNPFQMIFGYGLFGQATSGLTSEIAYSTDNIWNHEIDKISLHNFYYQTIIDIGIIGTAVLIIILYLFIKYFIKKEHSGFISIININFIFYLILLGTTEIVLNVYNYTLFIPFIFFLIIHIEWKVNLKTEQVY